MLGANLIEIGAIGNRTNTAELLTYLRILHLQYWHFLPTTLAEPVHTITANVTQQLTGAARAINHGNSHPQQTAV